MQAGPLEGMHVIKPINFMHYYLGGAVITSPIDALSLSAPSWRMSADCYSGYQQPRTYLAFVGVPCVEDDNVVLHLRKVPFFSTRMSDECSIEVCGVVTESTGAVLYAGILNFELFFSDPEHHPQYQATEFQLSFPLEGNGLDMSFLYVTSSSSLRECDSGESTSCVAANGDSLSSSKKYDICGGWKWDVLRNRPTDSADMEARASLLASIRTVWLSIYYYTTLLAAAGKMSSFEYALIDANTRHVCAVLEREGLPPLQSLKRCRRARSRSMHERELFSVSSLCDSTVSDTESEVSLSRETASPVSITSPGFCEALKSAIVSDSALRLDHHGVAHCVVTPCSRRERSASISDE